MRILHLFQWKLIDIINNLYIIKNQGFDSIQITPLQPNKFNYNVPWWGYYQPVDFKVGNQIGSKEDLKELCDKARKLDISIIADVVLNHVAGDDFGNIIPHHKVNKNLVDRKDFWKSFDRVNDWNSRYEVITKSIGLPSLDLKNHELQDIIIKFLNEYIDCGISGFRIDAAKHIPTFNEGNDFWTRVIGSIKDRTDFNYAEVIFTDKHIMDEYSKYINVLTEGTVSDENKLVTFFESHDTYNEFGYTRNMNYDMRLSEYRILCERFKNTIFYARPYDELWFYKEIKEIHTN